MYYRNIADLNQTILNRLNILPRDFDLIVGIPRSGMLPANLLALYLNKPYTDIDSFLNGHIYKAGERGQFFDKADMKKVLVVDDSIASGSALQKSRKRLEEMEKKFEISYCVIYLVPGKEKMVDYYFEAVPLPRYFQWNVFNHTSLEKACFDIDGVLCVDPTEEQNDDGPIYTDFVLNAPPLYIPGAKIGTIVTSRLEKYRKETEAWLEKHNVKYNELVMLDLPNKEARQKANSHAQHKAKTYQSKPYVLFIESSLSQANEINRITKKPVLCTENFEMIFEAQSLAYNFKSGKYFPWLREIALKVRNKYRQMKAS
ncbi:phosphoribosyltransferase family protein [uncultured Draconibacterium sp.]|uniref:phosphoribosyltransferase family protein n=1 Tax=uncultured Draconibacterium sp. TaxID=1573823 RepID=UPI002AA7A301|nr:phosphoribosyltransferase family protein [uncultured Draconibacterium sp.]